MWFCYVYNMERWKDIIGYEGLYQVSNLGRVRSLGNKTHPGIHLMKLIISKFGYVVIKLCKDGKEKLLKVHRLVAKAFIPNPLNLPHINHINEDKTDNRVSNLEWCDSKYNNIYGTRLKRVVEANTNGKLSKQVMQYTMDGEFVREWPSTKECGRNGFNQSAVAACCRGVKPHYKGYLWKYKGEA